MFFVKLFFTLTLFASTSFVPATTTIMSDKESTPHKDVFLNGRKAWPDWFVMLEYHCTFKGIWNLIDPSAPMAGNIMNQRPEAPSMREYIDKVNTERRDNHRTALQLWQEQGGNNDATKPSEPKMADFAELEREYTVHLRELSVNAATWTAQSIRY